MTLWLQNAGQRGPWKRSTRLHLGGRAHGWDSGVFASREWLDHQPIRRALGLLTAVDRHANQVGPEGVVGRWLPVSWGGLDRTLQRGGRAERPRSSERSQWGGGPL
jgi:hypothetical protein